MRRHPGYALVAVPCLALALVVDLVWFPGRGDPGTDARFSAAGSAPIVQNRSAPDFDLPRLSGTGRLSLHTLRGRVVIVNFWASWCSVCRQETDALRELSDHFAGPDVQFVGVDYSDESSSARAFARRTGMSYPSVVDETGDLLGKYGAAGLPITYVIGRDGRIRYEVIGKIDGAQLAPAIEQVRAERP